MVFHILNHPCIPGMKPNWSWWMIILMCPWIRLVRILLSIFASIFIWEIGQILTWGIPNGWETTEKMFNILNNQGNANQSNPEFYVTLVRMAKMKNSRHSRCWQECGERNTPPLLVGLQACTTTLEISLVVSQKIGHSTTRRFSNTSSGHISRRCPNR